MFKTNFYAAWDGTNGKGRDAAAGVYFCVIEYSCANDPAKIYKKQGKVMLVR
jgi:hypothetical protein